MPMREYYVLHTSRESLDITERQWLGVQVHRHTIARENGADFAPEFLYGRMVEQAAARGRADARL